jgi:hypothetical protein
VTAVACHPGVAPECATMQIFGGAIMLASNIVCWSGRELVFYMAGLSLLGVGWAAVYVAASSLVTGACGTLAPTNVDACMQADEACPCHQHS